MSPVEVRVGASRKLCVVASVLLLGACGGSSAGSPSASAAPATPGTVVEPTDPTPSADPAAPTDPAAGAPAVADPSVALAFARSIPTGSFAPLAETTIDDGSAVYVVADWKAIPSDAHEQLELRAPDGAVYASLDLAISAAKRGDVDFRVLDDGTTRLTYRLAIWGTQIESLPLTGAWIARVTLVGGNASATAGLELR